MRAITRKVRRSLAVALLCAVPVLGYSADEPATAERHMVVAANPHASEAGLRILRAGGSALDAAIAVQLVLSLVEPQSSGIGGGAFLLFFDAPDEAAGQPRIDAYQGRETAPAAATSDMFLDDDGNPASFQEIGVGGLSVGVPGVMRMLEMAHRDHGRLPWRDLFAPAIELAENGFEISPRLYFLLDRYERFASGEDFLAHYYDAGGKAHPTGYRLRNPDYAETLRLLAAEGAETMYSGKLAEAIVREVRQNSIAAGRMTLDDLRRYSAQKTEPLCSRYRQWRVCGPQLPSSGGVTVQQILGILSHFDLGELEQGSPETLHLIAEAGRLAFADRSLYLGDPEFVDAPVEALLAPQYLHRRAQLIDPQRALTAVTAGELLQAKHWNFSASAPQEMVSTSHYSIVDGWGDAVSITTSVQAAFGSQLMVGGFILNNQLTDFSSEPTRFGRPVANSIEAGKRPLSSMAPSMVLDDRERLRLVVGSPGGTRIINYVSQAIVGVLDFGLNAQQAVAAPHMVAQDDGPIELEENTQLLAHREALEAKGHRVVLRNLNSGLHTIVVAHGASGTTLHGGVDPRREGAALGD